MALTAQEIMMLGSGINRDIYSGNGVGVKLGQLNLMGQQLDWQKEQRRLQIAEDARKRAEAALQESMALEGQGRYAEAEAMKQVLRDQGYDPETLQYAPTQSNLLMQQQEPAALGDRLRRLLGIDDGQAPVMQQLPAQAQQSAAQPTQAELSRMGEEALIRGVDVSDYERELDAAGMRQTAPEPGVAPAVLGFDQGIGNQRRLDTAGLQLRDSTRRDVAGTELDPGLPVFEGGYQAPPLPVSETNRLALPMVEAGQAPQPGEQLKRPLGEILAEKYGPESGLGPGIGEPEAMQESPVRDLSPLPEGPAGLAAPGGAQAGVDRAKLTAMRKQRRTPWFSGMAQQYPEGTGITGAGMGSDMTLEAAIGATTPYYLDLMKTKRAEIAASRPRGGTSVNIRHSDIRGTIRNVDDLIKYTLNRWEIPEGVKNIRAAAEGYDAMLEKNGVLDAVMLGKMLKAMGEVRPSDADRQVLLSGIIPYDSQLANFVRDVAIGATNTGSIAMDNKRRRVFLSSLDKMYDYQRDHLEKGFESLMDLYQTRRTPVEKLRVADYISVTFPHWYERAREEGRIVDLKDFDPTKVGVTEQQHAGASFPDVEARKAKKEKAADIAGGLAKTKDQQTGGEANALQLLERIRQKAGR
jgi:hypothetical protein